MSCHVTSYHISIVSHGRLGYRIISYHIISRHIIRYLIISCFNVFFRITNINDETVSTSHKCTELDKQV